MGFKLTKEKTKQGHHLTNFLRYLNGLLQAILSCLNPPRLREVWAHPRSFACFDMVEARFTYGNETSEKPV